MTATPAAVPASPTRPRRRAAGVVPAFLIGLPLAAGLIALVHLTPLRDSALHRYLTHPVEYAEVILFCAAVGLLTMKLLQTLCDRWACARPPLPPWDGRPTAASAAAGLLAAVHALPPPRRASLLSQRVAAALDFLCRRGSAAELDDHLRDLADADADAQEASYGLIKFITWAIPILGFLGTVLGITEAIAGVNPEVLEKNLNAVTDGLATAFDTTAAALALTMVVMFYSFIVDRLEQGVLRIVDDYTAAQLAHRFERTAAEATPYLEALREQGRTVIEAIEQMARRQAAVWAESVKLVDGRQREDQQRLTAALEQALDRSLQGHARLAAQLQEEAAAATARQQAALAQVAEGITAQARVLAGLQAGEQHLVRAQESLDRNLHLLANAETLQQAVHTLTAAVHLLTARVEARPPGREKAA